MHTYECFLHIKIHAGGLLYTLLKGRLLENFGNAYFIHREYLLLNSLILKIVVINLTVLAYFLPNVRIVNLVTAYTG